MFTATMIFTFKADEYDKGCSLWREMIPDLAIKQRGCIRIQFLQAPPRAMAIGTWEGEEYATAFMKTGIFDRLLSALSVSLERPPEGTVWDTTVSMEP